eukprot:CAMPEP_0114671934 /NCGR_PEP_ID=MMETSP0191-20121206/42026_1 /TAXON_ID=126664 /ORGANISM="Sorites sp." /LENGTH=128 /DNA_ID=CAMNT_0001933017 /DNA_START=2980 /DNA_END=3364 /DNA_ORIENTATION=+
MGCCQAKKDDNSYQKIDDKPALVKAVSKVANTVKDGAVYGAVFTAGKVKDGAIVGVNAVGKGVSRAKSGVSILKDHIIDNEDGPLMFAHDVMEQLMDAEFAEIKVKLLEALKNADIAIEVDVIDVIMW